MAISCLKTCYYVFKGLLLFSTAEYLYESVFLSVDLALNAMPFGSGLVNFEFRVLLIFTGAGVACCDVRLTCSGPDNTERGDFLLSCSAAAAAAGEIGVYVTINY